LTLLPAFLGLESALTAVFTEVILFEFALWGVVLAVAIVLFSDKGTSSSLFMLLEVLWCELASLRRLARLSLLLPGMRGGISIAVMRLGAVELICVPISSTIRFSDTFTASVISGNIFDTVVSMITVS
jgi:hypothetical protein